MIGPCLNSASFECISLKAVIASVFSFGWRAVLEWGSSGQMWDSYCDTWPVDELGQVLLRTFGIYLSKLGPWLLYSRLYLLPYATTVSSMEQYKGHVWCFHRSEWCLGDSTFELPFWPWWISLDLSFLTFWSLSQQDLQRKMMHESLLSLKDYLPERIDSC